MIFTPLAERTLTTTLRKARDRRPDHPALREPSRSLSYVQVWEAACRFAGGYHSLGVAHGDRVLLMLDNHVDAVLSWLGLSFAGAVETLVNTGYRGSILTRVISDSGARVAVVEEHYVDQFLEAAGGVIETLIVRRPVPAAGSRDSAGPDGDPRFVPFGVLFASPAIEPAHIDPWDLMAIIYTSGTTGLSKGVLLTHAAAHCTAETVGNAHQDDVRFVVLPLFHAAGQWGGVYRALIAGATAYIAPGFHASTFWREAIQTGATTTQLVGAMADFLLRQPASPDDAGHAVREVHMVPVVDDVEQFAQRFGVQVLTAYGSTESGNPIFDLGAPGIRKGRVGTPSALMELRIVDENDVEVEDGRVGEGIVRSSVPWLFTLGYNENPEASLKLWRNGWLHTGDAFYRDPDGFYHYVDRLSDSLRRRGENVSSVELEMEVNSHPDIVESSAIGIPSSHTEDEIKVVAIRASGSAVTEAELESYLTTRLPDFMVPRYIEFVDDFPRTPTAKVRKHLLREMGVGAAWDREAARAAEARLPNQRRPLTTPL